MNPKVIDRILHDRRIAYAITDRDLNVIEVGGLTDEFCRAHDTCLGHPLLELIPELVGSEDVLANILGLSVYDRLEDEAKSRARQQEAARTQMESSLGEMGEELSQQPTLAADLAAAEAELARVTAAAAEKEAKLYSQRQEREVCAGC